ncbi:hypothetical protein N9R43_00955 [bacterium]|nr:hypothetical protein [bacterium]
MSNAIYIIAYHGNDPETRQKRSDNHNKQIEWWLDYDTDIEIRILAQDFIEDEYWDNTRVKYIDRLDSPVPPAGARNILLNHFYDTDEQWAIFADSDAILNLHPNFPHTHLIISDILRKFPENFKDVDLFWPHWDGRPGDGAFYDKFNNVDPAYKSVDWVNELCFDRKFGSMKGTMFFLKNNSKRIMMDESFNGTGKLIPGEDDEFAIAMALANYKTYILRNTMLKEFTAGSTHAGEQSTRKAEMLKGDDIIKQKHNLPDDRAKWYKMVKRNGFGMQKRLTVPLNKKIEESTQFDWG